MGPKLLALNINIIFVQISEAHSVDWPLGNIIPTIQPHKNIDDRFERAELFISKYFNNQIKRPFYVLVDTWDNTFDEIFQSWPDKFYLIDNKKQLLQTSTYGEKQDALIDEDYSQILYTMINK